MDERLRGIVAILRGVTPAEVLDVADALIAGGVRAIEVPLNSPDPFASLSRLAVARGSRVLVGAGTVLTADDACRVAEAGASLVLSPNVDLGVLRACTARGLIAVPGVATPTEGFAALAAGAHALKLFPAEMLGPPVLKAWRAVFPPGTAMLPVGGVGLGNLVTYKAAGAAGAGIGSSLYTPGIALDVLRQRAAALVAAWRAG